MNSEIAKVKRVTTGTPIPQHTMRRLNRLPCDGVLRYKVGNSDALTYDKAYDLIFNETGCKIVDDNIQYRQAGIRRLLVLNEKYAGVARDFILAALAKREEEGKELAKQALRINAELAQMKVVEGFYKELDDLKAKTSGDPASPEYPTAEQSARMVELETLISGCIWRRKENGKYERTRALRDDELPASNG